MVKFCFQGYGKLLKVSEPSKSLGCLKGLKDQAGCCVGAEGKQEEQPGAAVCWQMWHNRLCKDKALNRYIIARCCKSWKRKWQGNKRKTKSGNLIRMGKRERLPLEVTFKEGLEQRSCP